MSSRARGCAGSDDEGDIVGPLPGGLTLDGLRCLGGGSAKGPTHRRGDLVDAVIEWMLSRFDESVGVGDEDVSASEAGGTDGPSRRAEPEHRATAFFEQIHRAVDTNDDRWRVSGRHVAHDPCGDIDEMHSDRRDEVTSVCP